MLNYNNLSDTEFEVLCKDILSKKLGINMHVYAKGRDSGIDAANGDMTIILQAKHYINSNFSKLRYELKSELKKAEKLHPQQYYVMTSCRLTPDNRDEIYQMFRDFMESSDNIWSLEDIDYYLNDLENIDILRRHIGLWLGSYQVLDLLLFSKCEEYQDKKILADYYHYILERFCELPEEREAALFGNESKNTSYIDPYCKDNGKLELLINSVEKWCSQRAYGVMLLHGEPGHGKTSFCRKCVFEYFAGNNFKEFSNVLTFSLNPARSDILAESRLKIENAFTWGMGNPLLSVADCKDSVIFLDGFDEFIDEARKKGVLDSIVDFMEICFEFSKEHKARIVITSRSMCVLDDIADVRERYQVFQFEPLTSKQQDDWILAREEYKDYLDTFRKINSSGSMKAITGIPILFRMIVTARFDQEIDSRASLYKELFYLTQRRQNYSESTIKQRYRQFENLAYSIFADNEDTAEVDDTEINAAWTYSYYVKKEGTQRIGFLHRSFYEDFLSSFFLRRLSSIQSDEERKEFITLLSVRKLTREYVNSLNSALLLLKRDDGKIDEIAAKFQNILDYISKHDLEMVECFLHSTSFSYTRLTELEECVFYNINVINYAINQTSYVDKTHKHGYQFLTHFDMAYMSRGFNYLNMGGAILRGNYSYLQAENVHLENSVMSAVILEKVTMSSVHLDSSTLTSLTISDSSMTRACLKDANLAKCKIKGADLSYSSFVKARVMNTQFFNSELVHSDLSGVTISDSSFYDVDFSYSNMSNIKIRNSIFDSKCTFDYAILSNEMRSVLEEQGLNLKKVIWVE